MLVLAAKPSKGALVPSAAKKGSCTWGPWISVESMARRDGHIRELWAMGWSKKKIAELVGLTPQRVTQIVRSVA